MSASPSIAGITRAAAGRGSTLRAVRQRRPLKLRHVQQQQQEHQHHQQLQQQKQYQQRKRQQNNNDFGSSGGRGQHLNQEQRRNIGKGPDLSGPSTLETNSNITPTKTKTATEATRTSSSSSRSAFAESVLKNMGNKKKSSPKQQQQRQNQNRSQNDWNRDSQFMKNKRNYGNSKHQNFLNQSVAKEAKNLRAAEMAEARSKARQEWFAVTSNNNSNNNDETDMMQVMIHENAKKNYDNEEEEGPFAWGDLNAAVKQLPDGHWAIPYLEDVAHNLHQNGSLSSQRKRLLMQQVTTSLATISQNNTSKQQQ